MGQVNARELEGKGRVASETLDVTKRISHLRRSTSSAGAEREEESKSMPIVFRWSGKASEVSVTGTFNNWKTLTPLQRYRDDFLVTIDVPQGIHQYKFKVDGKWRHDPNEARVANESEGFDNIMQVVVAETNVEEAIEDDISQSKTYVPDSPSGEYGQEFPRDVYRCGKLEAPPWLPPQLMQGILSLESTNKEDPSLLAEPQHIMLNHLYAKSIHDEVLMVSTTHRYKQKYVTTMLYKDISEF
eukprot:m.308976 g.308976  ORF g.308976 m.308976 type:complete len:243 (+) comp45220_c0_seq1:82-810(+)